MKHYFFTNRMTLEGMKVILIETKSVNREVKDLDGTAKKYPNGTIFTSNSLRKISSSVLATERLKPLNVTPFNSEESPSDEMVREWIKFRKERTGTPSRRTA